MEPSVRFRWAWWLLAYVSLGLGLVGVFVPGLPTTVFILIAAWAAARGWHVTGTARNLAIAADGWRAECCYAWCSAALWH